MLLYIYIYKVKCCIGRPVVHIPPPTGDRGFKETAAGLLNVLRCDCVTNAFYVTIPLLVEIV